jgi:acetolactate synthase-1/3 small subunit
MTSDPRSAAIPRTFIVYVEDRPGVLNRVVSLFRRRLVNIESLSVGRSERPDVSRITLVVRADRDAGLRLEANLYKLVDVLEVHDVTTSPAVVREMAFVKLETRARGEVMQLCEAFRARIVDVGPESITVESTGAQDKIDGLIEALRPLGIVELVRTGAVAMTRGLAASDPLSRPTPAARPQAELVSPDPDRTSHREA